jgi:microcystin-dependent protein
MSAANPFHWRNLYVCRQLRSGRMGPFCDGSLLPISQYQPLFALIGTCYGGTGTTNFALPDLRGRVPIH